MVIFYLVVFGILLKSGGILLCGYMYLQVVVGDEVYSYGFVLLCYVLGEVCIGVQYVQVCYDDVDEYLDLYYSCILEIIEEYYGCLCDFVEELVEFEFDVDCLVIINCCSDFVWVVLYYVGLYLLLVLLDGSSNLGEFVVLFNLLEIQCIVVLFLGSDLNVEIYYVMFECEVEYYCQGDCVSDELLLMLIEVVGILLDFLYLDYCLFLQLIQKVVELDVVYGCLFDVVSQCISVSLLVLVKQNNFLWVDYVLLSWLIQNSYVVESIFIVQGDCNDLGYCCVSIVIEVVVKIDVVDLLWLKE